MAITVKPTIKRTQVASSDPVFSAKVITESDTNYLEDALGKPIATRGLIVATDGTIRVEFAGPDSTLYTLPVLAGVVYPFCVVRVHTDSNAGVITGLF